MTLNVAPLVWSQETIPVGYVEYEDEDQYEALRMRHQETHVFRFDSRNGRIANVTLVRGALPLGDVEPRPVSEHLMLCGKAVQASILGWLSNHYVILRRGKPITFWAKANRHRLLSRALRDASPPQNPLSIHEGLDVFVRFRIDTRVLNRSSDQVAETEGGTTRSPDDAYLGLVIDLNTTNVIDIPVEELARRGVRIEGRYVCKRTGEDELLLPRLETVGRVSQRQGQRLLLTDTAGVEAISTSEAFLEPRQENFEDVVRALYDGRSDRVLRRLSQLRSTYATALGKLDHLRQTLRGLKRHHLIEVGGATVAIGEFLTDEDEAFPVPISTSRPTCLFGPQGRKTNPYPDAGVQRFGPYQYMYHAKNTPLVVVVAEASKRGRVEQFVEALRSGFPEEEWEAVTAWQRQRSRSKPNPFPLGLIGKFRLSRVDFHVEEAADATAEAYRAAADRALLRLPRPPDLAIVQTQRRFRGLYGNANPYLVTKAAFMGAGVPVQAVTAEVIEASPQQQPYILNNVALASYAKLGGTPWVIRTREPSTHEVVVGIGYTEVGEGRLSERTRYVGIATLFQGNGQYVTWDLTREVEFERYAEALLESLRTTVKYVEQENAWSSGDKVRLVFHVHKPLKRVEIEAVKELVGDLLSAHYDVEYAFLNLRTHHPFQLFDPSQEAVKYSLPGRRGFGRKGKGVPARGVAYQLDDRTALLQLIGPRDLKTEEQGAPQPLRIDLHPDSDLDDITYLVRQVFHFTYLSWRSFFPAAEPVTALYSKWIAQKLADLRTVEGWNSRVLTVGALRGSKWFL